MIGCVPGILGLFNITVTVTDVLGVSGTSGVLAFRIYPVPETTTPTASPVSVDVGQMVNFTTSASGGTGVYATYSWAGLPTGICSGMDLVTVTCMPDAAGVYSVTVFVIDSNSFASNASHALSFTVFADPTARVLAPPPTVVGWALYLQATVTFGSGSPTYHWAGLPVGCPSVSSTYLNCTPTSSGSFSITISVEDSNGFKATSAAVPLSVLPALSNVTLTSTLESFDVGQTTYLNASVSGGSDEYSYLWTGLPAGCVTVDEPLLTCTPTSASGSPYKVTVTVKDTVLAGLVSTGNITLTMFPALAITSFTSSQGTLDLGQTLLLTMSVGGGSGGYTITWNGLPTGCSAGSQTSVSCVPRSTGTSDISVSVTDSNGVRVVSDIIMVVVNPTLQVTVTVSSTTVQTGETVDFFAGIVRGTGPVFTYLWKFGDGSSSSQPDPTHVYGTAGTYPVTVEVTDAAGVSVIGSLNMTVSAPPSPSPTILGTSESTGLIIIGLLALVLVLIVLLALLLVRRRGKGQQENARPEPPRSPQLVRPPEVTPGKSAEAGPAPKPEWDEDSGEKGAAVPSPQKPDYSEDDEK
jgi:hypothetical protein